MFLFPDSGPVKNNPERRILAFREHPVDLMSLFRGNNFGNNGTCFDLSVFDQFEKRSVIVLFRPVIGSRLLFCAAEGVRAKELKSQGVQDFNETMKKIEADSTLQLSNVEISSSDIRSRIQEGRSIRYLVPERVREYIEENGLYRQAAGKAGEENSK